jgi:hypothetical protein
MQGPGGVTEVPFMLRMRSIPNPPMLRHSAARANPLEKKRRKRYVNLQHLPCFTVAFWFMLYSIQCPWNA